MTMETRPGTDHRSSPVHPKGSSVISVTDGSWRMAEGIGDSYGGSMGLFSSGCTPTKGGAALSPTQEQVTEDHTEDGVVKNPSADSCREISPTLSGDADVEADNGTRRTTSMQDILRRTLTGITVSGIRHSTLTLVCTALGACALSISYIFQLCGLVIGGVSLIFGSFVAYLSTVALMQMCTQTGCQTYASLFSHVAGPFAGPCLDCLIFIYGNGVLVLCLVFLGDFIPALINLAPDAPAWAVDRKTAIVFCAVIVFPLGLPREITALTRFTKLQIFGIAYTAVLVAAKAPNEFGANHDKPGYGPTQLFKVDMSLIEAFPLCIYAFNCHSNVVPIAGRLVRPTRARIVKLSSWVALMQIFFYLLIGVAGYLSFLDKTPQDVLQGYDLQDPFVVTARAVLTPSLIVVIGMNLQPAMRSGLRLIDACRGASTETWAPVSPTASPPGTPPNSPRRSPQLSVRQAPDTEHKGPVVVLSLVCLATQACIAIAVPNAADIIGIVGATVGTTMMLLIPAYLMRAVLPNTPANIATRIILYLSAVVSLISVPIKILRLAGYLPSSTVT